MRYLIIGIVQALVLLARVDSASAQPHYDYCYIDQHHNRICCWTRQDGSKGCNADPGYPGNNR